MPDIQCQVQELKLQWQAGGVIFEQCLCRKKHSYIASIVLLELKERTESNFTDKEKIITTDRNGKIFIYRLKV